MLTNKEIILGVSGSIAAYKAVEILRELSRLNASVTVVMTKNAQKFIQPLTFQTLSRRKPITTLFDPGIEVRPEHIALSKRADLLLVAPATANIIGKFANGIADDFLSSLFLSMPIEKVLLAPAMNPAMYSHPILQKNLRVLKEHGLKIIEPETGQVACGDYGQGRLASLDKIINQVIQDVSSGKGKLKHRRVLITAGPTREYLDPIRYLSNGSSGKMGYALARAAYRRGALVTLISGPSGLTPPGLDIKYIPVVTTEEMKQAVEEHFNSCSVVIMAAAVSDFKPGHPAMNKIKKNLAPSIQIELIATPDILQGLGQIKKPDQLLVGFAAETDQVIERARLKLQAKHLDLICVNDVTQKGAGFEVDTNIISLIDRHGRIEDLPLMSKDMAAGKIFDKIEALL